MPKPPHWYYVMTYDGNKVYSGRSEDKAATSLVSGTVIGQGATERDAWDNARINAKEARAIKVGNVKMRDIAVPE